MPNRPAPLHQAGQVTLQPGSALAANVGIDQTTPLANTVTLAGTLPPPAGGSTPVTLASTPLPVGAALEAGNLRMSRQVDEFAFFRALDMEILALAFRGRERMTLSTSRGGR